MYIGLVREHHGSLFGDSQKGIEEMKRISLKKP